jgi:hypothetical protein
LMASKPLASPLVLLPLLFFFLQKALGKNV